MSVRILGLGLFAITVAVAGSASAQPGGGAGGGRMMGQGGALHGACRGDVMQLCAGVEPGGGRIGQCLRAHQDRVSEGCKDAISSARAQRGQQQGGAPKSPPAPPSGPS